MTNPLLEPTTELRDKAWQSVVSTPAYAYFKAMDDAVVAAGGTSHLSHNQKSNRDGWTFRHSASSVLAQTPAPRARIRHKLTQTGAAEIVLRETGAPLSIATLLKAVIAKGIEFRGDDPLPSFRSAMSKDARFTSQMRNGMHFWWFTGETLPSNWNEAEGADLLAHPSASSVHSNQEGGGGHAATTT
jgi:hypothetical protein